MIARHPAVSRAPRAPRRFTPPANRFSALARAVVLLSALVGSVLAATAVRAGEVEATGALTPRAAPAPWWQLRPVQGPVIEVPRGEGADLPEARKAVRMVYPAPYPVR